MARYRRTSSRSGSYFDKITDGIQVTIWFGAVAYAAYLQTQTIIPVFLAFFGVSFYLLRGYIKYVTIYTEMSDDKEYLIKKHQENLDKEKDKKERAGLGFGVLANLRWFVHEQKKLFFFDEGVFIFMISAALIFNILEPILWVFAISQVFYGLYRGCQKGYQMANNQKVTIKK